MVRVAHICPPNNEKYGIGVYAATLSEHLTDCEMTRVELDPEGGILEYASTAAECVSDTDIVHVQFDYILFGDRGEISVLFFPVVGLLSAIFNFSVVVTMHEILTSDDVIPPLRRLKSLYLFVVNSIVYAFSDDIIYLSENAAGRFRTSLTTVDSHVIPHGVEIDRQIDVDRTKAKHEFGYDEDTIVITEPGYVSPRKGSEKMVEIASTCPEYEFMIAGGCPRPRLKGYYDEIVDSAPENLRVTGVLPGGKFHTAFRATDVALLPYVETSQGGVTNRINQSGVFNWCVTYGLPVIASDHEYFQRIENRYGCVVTVDLSDPKEVTDVVRKVASDEELRNDMVEGLREYESENSFEAVSSKHQELYQSLF